MTCKENYFLGLNPQGFHRLFYQEWGEKNSADTLICVHGLTRNSRDFSFLAEQLQHQYRVICPDVVGRGKSDWLNDKNSYQFAQYLADISVLIGRLEVNVIDWLGTSMGGLLGIFLASLPNTPIRKLIINDVGPFVPREALIEISQYAGNDLHFETFEEVVNYFKQLYVAWGDIPEQGWVHMATHSSSKLADGNFSLAYDQGFMASMKQHPEAITDFDIWPVFEKIQCPVLVLHGLNSKVLSNEVAQQMKLRGKNVELVDFPGIGHAPHLMTAEHISIVRNWLQK